MKIPLNQTNKKILIMKILKNENQNNEDPNVDEDEFNPTLAAMENEIKPKVLKTIHTLTKEYNKLIKYQKERLQSVLLKEKILVHQKKKIMKK